VGRLTPPIELAPIIERFGALTSELHRRGGSVIVVVAWPEAGGVKALPIILAKDEHLDALYSALVAATAKSDLLTKALREAVETAYEEKKNEETNRN